MKANLLVMSGAERGARFWLRVGVITLAILNAAALVLYVAPPGGSRASLTAQSQSLQMSLAAARSRTNRLKTISAKVQTGSEQAVDFQARYILPRRLAYELVLADIQKMAQAANLTERDGVWTEEPIEGSADLTVLNNTTNFEGSYANLVKFLYEVDRLPKLLMLDTLTATPQKAGQITAQVKFQAIMRDSPAVQAGGQP